MRHRRKIPGVIIAVIGLLIILSMLLPTSFWWFILGVALIAVGVSLMKR